VLAVVTRARRRLWLQRSAKRLGLGLAVLGLLAAPIALAVRLDLWPTAYDNALLLGAAVAVTLLALGTTLHREAWLATARRVDMAAGGNDRLATALWLAGEQRDDGWAQVQAQAAAAFAQNLPIAKLFAWSWPRGAWAWPLAIAAVVLAVWLPVRALRPVVAGGDTSPASGVSLALPGAPAGFQSAAELLGPDALDLLAVDEEVLRQAEAQVQDEPTRKWLQELRKVVTGVRDGSLDKRQVLEKLAELEAARPKPTALDNLLNPKPDQPEGAAAPAADAATAQQQADQAVQNAIADAAKAAAQAAPDGQEKDELRKAAESKDLDALAKLAEKLAARDMSDKELEKWVKAVEKFADALKDQKVPEKFKALAERIDRLQKKRAQEGGLGASDQERLKQSRHDLEQLKRQEGDALAAQNRVQRLERGARQAADELKREQGQRQAGKDGPGEGPGKDGEGKQPGAKEGGGPEAKDGKGKDGKGKAAQLQKSMQKAADELRRESQEQQSRQAQRIGEARMRDLREAMEQAGERTAARKSFEQKAREQRDDKGGKKRLKDGQEAPEGEKEEEGDEDAGAGKEQEAQKGKSKPSLKLGKGKLDDKSRMELLREGYQEQEKSDAAGGPGNTGGGGGEKGKDPGRGDGEDDKDKAASGRMAGGDKQKLTGAQGEGPDIKKTFVEAARKGFARQGWREVYADYSEVAEEMLDKEQLPPGRRATVRRYFELIRPR